MNPSQRKAIAASDKEKLVKTGVAAPIKPPKVTSIGKGITVPKPKVAGVPAAPAFGRKRFYGQAWD